SAISKSYTKTPGIASKTRRLRQLSLVASSPSGPPATTPKGLRSASPVAPPSRASSPPEQESRRSRRPQATWSPEQGPSRQKPGASSNPISSSGTRKRRRCRACRPTLPPPARPGRVRLCENRSAASQRTPGHPSRTKSPRRPHCRQHAPQRRGVDADGHAHCRVRDRHLDPFGRTRQEPGRVDRVRSRVEVVELELHELRPFARCEPRLAPPHVEQSPVDPVAP